MIVLRKVQDAISGWRAGGDGRHPFTSECVTVGELAAVLDVLLRDQEVEPRQAEEMLPVEHPKGTCVMVPVTGLVLALRKAGYSVERYECGDGA
jgi:hypothetical protein